MTTKGIYFNGKWYADSDAVPGGTLSANLDTIVRNGFFTCYSDTQGLSAEMKALDVSWHIIHVNSNVGTGGACQIAVAFITSPITQYTRTKVGGTWGVWRQTYQVELMTEAEYNALVTPDPNVVYFYWPES